MIKPEFPAPNEDLTTTNFIKHCCGTSNSLILSGRYSNATIIGEPIHEVCLTYIFSRFYIFFSAMLLRVFFVVLFWWSCDARSSIHTLQLRKDLSASSFPSTRGFLAIGASQAYPGQQSGTGIRFAGDVNKDGYDDYIIGAPQGGGNYQGVSYVLFGGSHSLKTNATNIDLSTFQSSASRGVKIFGSYGNGLSGTAVTGTDVNKDGYADVIIGEYNSNPVVNNVARNRAGTTYVVYGKANFGSAGDVNTNALTTATGFTVTGARTNDYSGRSVARAGDFNGDGYEDFLIGAYYATRLGRPYTGCAYVIYGSATPSNVDLASLTASQGFEVIGAVNASYAGYAVSSAGDFNNDGITDVIIGAYWDGVAPNAQRGVAYILFGKRNNGYTKIDLRQLTSSQGIRVIGERQGDQLGFSVSRAGDFNGDGIADIIIGANFYNADESISNGGAVYIIYGKTGIATDIQVGSLTSAQGITIVGAGTNDNLGFSVTGGGDIDRDGYSDVVFSANQEDVNGKTLVGVVYVMAGRPGLIRTRIMTDRWNSTYGYKISGTNSGDYFGSFVDNRGDLNADGYSDILAASPMSSPLGRSQAGTTYMMYGEDTSPTAIPTAVPTFTPSASPSAIPTAIPTAVPSFVPTAIPTATPSAAPSATPTAIPSAVPSATPTDTPTFTPSASPTVEPSATPTFTPSADPTATPTAAPSAVPTIEPTADPSTQPTYNPTAIPTFVPSAIPTARPTFAPTLNTTAQLQFDLYFNLSYVRKTSLSRSGVLAAVIAIQSVTDLPLINIIFVNVVTATDDTFLPTAAPNSRPNALKPRNYLRAITNALPAIRLTDTSTYTLLIHVLMKIDIATHPNDAQNTTGLCQNYRGIVQNSFADGSFIAKLDQYAHQFQADELYQAEMIHNTASTSGCSYIDNNNNGGTSTSSQGSSNEPDKLPDWQIALIVVLTVGCCCCCCCWLFLIFFVFPRKNEEKEEEQIALTPRGSQSNVPYTGVNSASGDEYELGENTTVMFLSSADAEDNDDNDEEDNPETIYMPGYAPRKQLAHVPPTPTNAAKTAETKSSSTPRNNNDGNDGKMIKPSNITIIV